jgi:ABC-type uncharacterized transport system auxiliary subunit
MRLLLIFLASCALTSKAAPRELRYFTVETAQPASRMFEQPKVRVRLGRIAPGAHLRAAIVHRDSAIEETPYETLRWTEMPDAYVRRALVRELFEQRPLDQAIGGDAPALEIELVAFEEVVSGAKHAGRVELRYQLHDEHRVIARGTIVVERDASGPGIEVVVPAIAGALADATAQVADRVVTALCPP